VGTPRAERLFLGGSSWGVRGYSPASISPMNSKGIRIGGYRSAVVSFEASIPVNFVKGMRLTGFIDYGMIGTNSFSEVKRGSVGAQIEWASPFGPVNLIFAKPFKDKSYDRTAKFEFTIGSKF
jgi:outer membrane protein insertion porin family